jgi:hypothetical protein
MVYPCKKLSDPRVQKSLTEFKSATCRDGSPFAALPPQVYARKTGFFNTEIFRSYILHCVPFMRLGVPDEESVLLLVDGAKHHISPAFWLELKKLKVELLVFPPNLTKYWMPSDARPWHGVFKRRLRHVLLLRGGATSMEDWMGVLGGLVAQTMTPGHAKSAFRHVGLVIDPEEQARRIKPIMATLVARVEATGEVTELISKRPELARHLSSNVLDMVADRREKKRAKASNTHAKAAQVTGWVTQTHNVTRLKRVIEQAKIKAVLKICKAAARKRHSARSREKHHRSSKHTRARPKGASLGSSPRVGKNRPPPLPRPAVPPAAPRPLDAKMVDSFLWG